MNGNLSSKDRGRRKEMWRIIKADGLSSDNPTRFAVALVVLGSPDVRRAAAIANVPMKEARIFNSRLRDSRIIHRDRLDLSSFSSGFPDRGKNGGAVVAMVLLALVCAGEIDKRKPCKHCGNPVARAGYDPSGVQRWRCHACGKTFVYARNPIERMRAPWQVLERAAALSAKGNPPSLVASRTGLSLTQAEKVIRLVGEGYQLRSNLCAAYGPGQSKRATRWSPDALDVHKVLKPEAT